MLEKTSETPTTVSQEEATIEIVIDKKGNIVLETVGTVGKQCDLLAGALEANLGPVTSRTNKETYEDGSS